MTTAALFHSALGVRPGVEEEAELLRSRGHDARVVGQYDEQEGIDAVVAAVDAAGATAEVFDLERLYSDS